VEREEERNAEREGGKDSRLVCERERESVRER
jgi:hypothetical protein